jgi:glycosyltransferase involved in cell wall biosynthesis
MRLATDEQARDPPRVGVLLPVFAGADPSHFRESVLSLRAQQDVNMRIYLGCDGALSSAHERVIDELMGAPDVVLRSETRSGLSRTLNRTIEAALEDPSIAYLARMDADDISVPQRFAKQVRFLSSHPEVGVVGSWCIEFSEPGVPAFHKKLPSDALDLGRIMVYRSPLAHPSVMFHRRVFDAGFRYDPAYDGAEDYELWSRLVLAGVGISNLPDYLLWYRMSPDVFARRAGWDRALTEVSLRIRYARAAGLLRPRHFLGLAGLTLVRIVPVSMKKWAYRLRG